QRLDDLVQRSILTPFHLSTRDYVRVRGWPGLCRPMGARRDKAGEPEPAERAREGGHAPLREEGVTPRHQRQPMQRSASDARYQNTTRTEEHELERSALPARIARVLSVVALCALAVPSRPAYAQGRVFSGAPAASWIAPPAVPGDSAVVFHARRTFDLSSRPEKFLVHVSADNRYRLYVNGEEVSSGPQRSDVMHWRYETVDLAPKLRAGRNVVAALVWNWGAAHPLAQHSLRTGLLVQGNTEREVAINTGAGWKLRVDSAYKFVPLGFGEVRGYYAASPGEAVDAARYPWGW